MIPLLLSMTAGATDTAGFLGLSGLFTAHVTGNFVLLGATLVTGGARGAVGKLIALPVFVLGVFVARNAAMWRAARGGDAMRDLLIGKMVLLAGFFALAVGFGPFPEPDAPIALLAGTLGVAAMAVQNAIGRIHMASVPATTVMTGNVTQLVIDLADWSRGAIKPEAHQAVRARVGKTLVGVVAFAAGCAVSALGYAVAGFWCLGFPLGLAVASAILRSRRPATP